jgi:DNA-binding transcriptional LysR family regulator
MNAANPLDLDGHALGLLLAVAETGSVTRAAERLGLTQSAVSHALDKLRVITGDALFVRCGRGIVATPRVAQLVPQARALMAGLQALGAGVAFDPARWEGVYTIAANDLQRDLLLPGLLRRLRAQAPGLRLRVIPSGAPRAALLRDGGCDLLLTPRPPEGSDIVQRRLFDDVYAVFFDAQQRAAPVDAADWLAADHVSVAYEDGRGLDIDEHLAALGHHRHIVTTVPGFAGIAALLRGGPWLATLPSRLAEGVLHGLATAPVPVPTPVLPMYAVWHRRQHDDPAQRWLRGQLFTTD